MADARFIFEIVERGGGGGGGTAPATGGGPMASPQTGERTQVREETEQQQGGTPARTRRRQKATDGGIPKRPLPRKKPGPPKPPLREPPKPKPPPPPVKAPPLPKPDPFSLAEQTKAFGTAAAKRVGLGGVAGAIGTAAVPLAAAGAVVAVAAAQVAAARAVSRQQAALAERVRPVSADLQVSLARETLRTTIQNIDIARRFGPQLAEAERRRGRFGAAVTEFGAQIAGGPIGEEVSALIGLMARALEAQNKFFDTVQRFIPSGPAAALSDILDELGIGVDPFEKFKGNLAIFQDFPHLEPPQSPAGTVAALDEGDAQFLGEMGAF